MSLRKLEASIDSYLAISYVNINKGDAKLIGEFVGRNKNSLVWSIIGLMGTVAIGVASGAVYDLIKIFLE